MELHSSLEQDWLLVQKCRHLRQKSVLHLGHFIFEEMEPRCRMAFLQLGQFFVLVFSTF